MLKLKQKWARWQQWTGGIAGLSLVSLIMSRPGIFILGTISIVVIFATHKVSTVEATATITDAFAMKNVDSSIIKSQDV